MRRLGGAAAAAAVLVLLTGCGSQAAPQPTETVTVAPSTSSLSSPADSPSATPSATRTTATGSASPEPANTPLDGDPDRPAGQCPDSSVSVSVARAADGGGAGSEYYEVLFVNTGGSSCQLRGTPGVSVVGDGNGTQIGPAADRNQSDVKTVTLPVGGTVQSQLQVVNIGTNGGPLPDCTVQKGDGYRVYPPHSKRAYFYRDSSAVACKNGPVFMTVGPVTAR